MSCTCEVKRVKVGVKKEDFFVLHRCPVHKAAPEMLKALELVHDRINDTDSWDLFSDDEYMQIHSAIAATGGGSE